MIEMELKELRKKIRVLEDEITRKCADFTEQTGVAVHVDVDTVDVTTYADRQGAAVYNVTCRCCVVSSTSV